MPVVLHVDLFVREGSEDALAASYEETFTPAIERQEGFLRVRLLRPLDAPCHRLVIEFTEEALRQRWVASDLHQEVWPQLEAHCTSFAPHLFSEGPA